MPSNTVCRGSLTVTTATGDYVVLEALGDEAQILKPEKLHEPVPIAVREQVRQSVQTTLPVEAMLDTNDQ